MQKPSRGQERALTPSAVARAQIRVHLAKEFVEDLKFVKVCAMRALLNRMVAVFPSLRLGRRCLELTPGLWRSQDENADMLRDTLSCSLKLPSMDSGGDIDDDGRPLKKS